MPIDHVSVPTAAKILGRHPDTIRRWIRDGQISVLRLPGRQPRISRATIARLLSENKTSVNLDKPTRHLVH
jgi:excisionase family DNA binding protein